MFVNLPVTQLKASMVFWARLGFSFDPRFTDDNAACLIVGEGSHVMLLSREFFQSFTTKRIADSQTHAQVITAFSAASREEVDRLLTRAVEIGAHEAGQPEDHGFMYGRRFEDADGHLWEVVWLDEAALPG